MASTSIFTSSFDEQKWITEISKILEKEVNIEIDTPVSIFRVPKSISVFNPGAYEPQLIAIGPYHHFRPELYEMERYKLSAVSRVQKEFQSLKFRQLVEKLIEHEHRIRACYHKYLDIEGDTLGWIMAIDGLFLLDFLNMFVKNTDKNSTSSTAAQIVDQSGKKLNHDKMLGDILMLENQIPIFLLSKILSIQCSVPEIENYMLPTILFGFCKSLSPLKLENDLKLSQVCNYAHLLDLLYHLIVPKMEASPKVEGYAQGKGDASSFSIGTHEMDSSKPNKVFSELRSMFRRLNPELLSKIMKPIWKMIDKVRSPLRKVLRIPTILLKLKKPVSEDTEDETPRVEEIMIPSVSYLRDAGVIFSPSPGGISTVRFDRKTKTFHLPVLVLEANSEIVMRNLVAYESSAMSNFLVFSRYTDMMSGIINSEEDVKLLRKKKIIINRLKCDADVAELFNGMSKSVRLTKVPFLNKTIEDVNKYFGNTPKVRIYRRIEGFVQGSWQILTVLAVILLMLFMALQSVCSIFSCPQLFKTNIFEE